MKRLLAITALTALLGCAAAAQSADTLAPAASVAASERVDVSCNIRTPRTANGVSIQGVASADRDLDGDYELHITKSGANSSDVSQAGAFTLRARASAVLGESEISLSRGEHLRAVFILRSAGAELCRRDIQL